MKKKIEKLIKNFHSQPIQLPINKKELEEEVEKLFSQMFPLEKNEDSMVCEEVLREVYEVLFENISNLIDEKSAEKILDVFFEDLSRIKFDLVKNAEAFLENDPAAQSIEEVILTYPGFFALSVHRIAHAFYQLKVPIIPRLVSEYAHSKTGIDIHPGATIGKNFFLDHGTGVVIGETAIIGDNVKVYQGVTLGALYVAKNLSKVKRHPTVEDNVVIYSGATILGGETVIGHDSTIGGNVWLTRSVDPFTVVYYDSKMRIKSSRDFIDPINFVI